MPSNLSVVSVVRDAQGEIGVFYPVGLSESWTVSWSRINVHAEERILLNLFYTNLRLAGESRLGQWLHIRTNRSKCVKNFLVSTIQAWISGTRQRELRISPRFIFVHHWKTQNVCRSWPGPSTILKPNIIDDSGCMLDCNNQRWY